MTNRPTKKSEKIIVGSILIAFAVGLFVKEQYLQSAILIVILFILPRLDDIKKFTLDIKKGFGVEFEPPKEKIEQDIRENKKSINKRNFVVFKDIEERVLRHIQPKIGSLMKRQIHYVFGDPGNVEFSYTPDATIQTENELIFVEVKYISRPEYVNQITNNGIKQLQLVLQKLGPSAGKKLVAKLVLASDFFIDISKYKLLADIELVYFQL